MKTIEEQRAHFRRSYHQGTISYMVILTAAYHVDFQIATAKTWSITDYRDFLESMNLIKEQCLISCCLFTRNILLV